MVQQQYGVVVDCCRSVFLCEVRSELVIDFRFLADVQVTRI